MAQTGRSISRQQRQTPSILLQAPTPSLLLQATPPLWNSYITAWGFLRQMCLFHLLHFQLLDIILPGIFLLVILLLGILLLIIFLLAIFLLVILLIGHNLLGILLLGFMGQAILVFLSI